jgi:hypothetical protein
VWLKARRGSEQYQCGELANGVVVGSLAADRRQPVQHRRLGLFHVRERQVLARKRRSASQADPRDDKAGALIKRGTVLKLSQNPIGLTCLGICLERKQIPRIVENLRKSLNAKKTREADRLRPRQVRYQAALRPDFEDP